jgi:hypothetical protein
MKGERFGVLTHSEVCSAAMSQVEGVVEHLENPRREICRPLLGIFA